MQSSQPITVLHLQRSLLSFYQLHKIDPLLYNQDHHELTSYDVYAGHLYNSSPPIMNLRSFIYVVHMQVFYNQ